MISSKAQQTEADYRYAASASTAATLLCLAITTQSLNSVGWVASSMALLLVTAGAWMDYLEIHAENRLNDHAPYRHLSMQP